MANLYQYSCLENPPMDRRAWQATVHGVAKSRTKLSKLACTHAWLLLIISLVNSCDRDCMACKVWNIYYYLFLYGKSLLTPSLEGLVSMLFPEFLHV